MADPALTGQLLPVGLIRFLEARKDLYGQADALADHLGGLEGARERAGEERIGVDVPGEPVGNQVGLVPAQLGEAAILAHSSLLIAILERLAVADEDDVSGDGLRRSRASFGSRSRSPKREILLHPVACRGL